MQEVRGGGRYPMESRCDPHERQEADKLRKRQKVGSLSPEQKAELQAKHQAHIDDRAEIRKAELDMLVQKVRELGRYPKRPPRGKIDEKHAIDVCPAQQREWKLACDVFTARRSKHFSPEQEAELEALQEVERQKIEEARIKAAEELMQEVRNLGRYPKEGLTRPTDEIHLAEKLRKARSAKQISAEQEAELKALQQAEKDAKVAADIAEARDKPPAKKHKGTPDDSWQEGTIPVTIRMILDAHDCYGGSVGTLIVNGRGASMCMLVAQVVEKALKPDMPGRLILDDASGRIPVEVYRDQGQMTDEDELPRVGEYVRVVGTLSSCSERVQLTCRFIGRLVNDSEIPCHLIEVAHASLKLRLAEKLAMTRDKENTVNSSLPRDRSNISVVGPSDHWLHKDRSVPAP